jgi:class 3 adenylate cyclase
MRDDAFRMNRFTLRFADPAAEAAYAAEHARKAVRPVRILIAAIAAFVVLQFVLISTLAPRGIIADASENFAFRAIIVVASCAILYAITWLPMFLGRQQAVVACSFAALGAMAIVGTARMPADFLVTRGFINMLGFLLIVFSLTRLRFPQATALAWILTLAYVAYLAKLDVLESAALARHGVTLSLINIWGMLICYQMDVAARREFASMQLLAEERARSERLLLNILPAPIADRLKSSERAIAEHSDGVTVLFADLVGFTPLSARKTPEELVDLLNRVFTEFDALADVHGLEKIKTIGDAYMAVAGLPERRPDHAARAARMALAMRDAIERIAEDTGEDLPLRIGLHSGPVVAGVIGKRKFAYDMWGDTVNTASRMESHGISGEIHCSEETARLLDGFELQARDAMEIKGKGRMQTFLLLGSKGA